MIYFVKILNHIKSHLDGNDLNLHINRILKDILEKLQLKKSSELIIMIWYASILKYFFEVMCVREEPNTIFTLRKRMKVQRTWAELLFVF